MIRTIERKADGDPINLGNANEVVSINDLARTIIDISGKDIDIEHDPSQPTGTDKYCADTTKMEEALDWEPSVTLEEGLEHVYEWASGELPVGKRAAVADGGGTDG
jgi:UDP-glucose 4-epimerase